MFRKILTSLLLILTLSSCAAVEDAIDHAGDEGRGLITHASDELGKLKTEILEEVEATIERTMPQVIESILNADAVAFLIVAVTILGGLVIVTTLLLLLGAARAVYKRTQHPRGCSVRSQGRQ